jgi:glutamine synthetase
MTTPIDRDDIIKIIREKDVRFIRLQFTDMFGIPKNVAITSNQLEKALIGKCMFDGSSIEGFARIEESDMYLQPDLSTFMVLPWNYQGGSEARLICNVLNPDHTPFEGDPRYVLKKVIEKAEHMGYDACNIGPECEFFLFQTDADGNPTTKTQDDAGYFDLGPVDLGETARREMVIKLQEMGFDIEASHHEVAPGQHEIDFRYSNALKAADDIIIFKALVKTIAKRHGLYATFMPKPLYGVPGSGMHTNVSLFRNGENAFYCADDHMHLSKEAYCFIGGLLTHMKEITALTNPLVNSYKRLVSGYEAPVYIAWSAHNRSPLIRIPTALRNETRLEVRNPDPACNPYLAIAAILAAGLDGIEKQIEPMQPINCNIFELGEKQICELGVEKLPSSLKEAIDAMKGSSLVQELLGDQLFEKYIMAKELEWKDYTCKITQWEINAYLRKY